MQRCLRQSWDGSAIFVAHFITGLPGNFMALKSFDLLAPVVVFSFWMNLAVVAHLQGGRRSAIGGAISPGRRG
jgi:hypothetical protein